jgi:hypothetical protein
MDRMTPICSGDRTTPTGTPMLPRTGISRGTVVKLLTLTGDKATWLGHLKTGNVQDNYKL